MTITIITLGTRGDLQPFVALGLGLQRAGYEVRLVSSKNDEAFATGLGLPYYSLSADIQQVINSPEVRKMAQSDSPLAFIRSHLGGANTMKQAMATLQDEIWTACQGAHALIYHPGMANVFFMAGALGIPAIMASPFPLTATGAYPAVLFYAGPRLGRWYNRLTHFLFENAFWLLSKSAAQFFWKKQGQSRIVTSQPVSRLQAGSGMPVVYGYSEYLFPRPTDWPDSVQVTGNWTLPDDPHWTPPVDLLQFLELGGAPLYIGFGSIQDAETVEQTLDLLLNALAMVNRRAVIALGGNNAPDIRMRLPETIFLLDNIPHTWLFPRVSAVVHHGGAGTTAAGLRAGRASLIIPHTADQPAWGRRVYELGVGPRPIPRKKLTAQKLATALCQLADPTLVSNAAALGHLMQEEDGVTKAVHQLNAYFSQSGLFTPTR